ncbi:hypothetical protein ANCDUO_26394, partial [Ancylostoma duodenale]
LYILEGNRFVCQQDFQNATKSSTPSSTSNRPGNLRALIFRTSADTLHKVRIMLIREWCQRHKRLGHSAVSNPRALKRRAFTAASAGDEFTEHSRCGIDDISVVVAHASKQCRCSQLVSALREARWGNPNLNYCRPSCLHIASGSNTI